MTTDDKSITSSETPLPKKIAKEMTKQLASYHSTKEKPIRHICFHPDIEVLLDDVRRQRTRRMWIATAGITLLVTLFITFGTWIYGIGIEVGEAQTKITSIREAKIVDRIAISENEREIRRVEREQDGRYSEISLLLTRLDARLENIEKSLTKRRRR